MNAADVISTLTRLGASLRALKTDAGTTLRVHAPQGRVTPRLREEIRRHKTEILRELGRVEKFRHGDLAVIIWSGVLNEKVAVVEKEQANRLVPVGIVTYTAEEIERLRGQNLGAEALRLVHAVKRAVEGKVEDCEAET